MLCSFCNGVIADNSFRGRTAAEASDRYYCCYECLYCGENAEAKSALCSDGQREEVWRVSGFGVRIGIAIIIAAQTMIFELALSIHNDVLPSSRFTIQIVMMCGAVLVIALLGKPLVRNSLYDISHRRITIETLFAVTLCGALCASVQALLLSQGSIYFEVVSVLLVVYTIGKSLGAKVRRLAIVVDAHWHDGQRACRVVDRDGQSRMISIDKICIGDVLEVHAGEVIAVKGVIRFGFGYLSELAVTGDHSSVVRGPGDCVLAGYISIDASFQIEATTSGDVCARQRYLPATNRESELCHSLTSFTSRFSRAFVPVVSATSLSTFLYWTICTTIGWQESLFHAMSVLLVACPCVIGIAAPLVYWTTAAELSRRGVHIHSIGEIARLAEVDHILLDRTGTLTEHRATLQVIATKSSGQERERLISWLARVQEHSNHPIAAAFASNLNQVQQECTEVISVKVIPGCGVTSDISDNSGYHTIQIGTSNWILSVCVGGDSHDDFDPPNAIGRRIDVAVDGRLAAIAIVSDSLRKTAVSMIREFNRMMLPVEIVSGGVDETAADQDWPITHSGMLPEAKRKYVRDLQSSGKRTLMVGDGVNDAAAFAEAHASIALSTGSDLIIKYSSAILYSDDLTEIPRAIAIARRAVQRVRNCTYRAVAFNVIGMALAACGLLHPIFSALLMVGSSLMLLASSTCGRFDGSHCSQTHTVQYEHFRFISLHTIRTCIHVVGILLQCCLLFTFYNLQFDTRPMSIWIYAITLLGLSSVPFWFKWSSIPHTIDMCYGMLTLGNLGMLLGWWADHRFQSGEIVACSCKSLSTGPWMWIGMLLFSNAAMFFMGRSSSTMTSRHAFAMLIGGNLGMIAGMRLGGVWIDSLQLHFLFEQTMTHFIGMTGGMLIGMVLGTILIEQLILIVIRLRTIHLRA